MHLVQSPYDGSVVLITDMHSEEDIPTTDEICLRSGARNGEDGKRKLELGCLPFLVILSKELFVELPIIVAIRVNVRGDNVVQRVRVSVQGQSADQACICVIHNLNLILLEDVEMGLSHRSVAFGSEHDLSQ